MTSPPILSRVLDVSSLPAAGVAREIVASDVERNALAEAFCLAEVRTLSADLTVEPGRAGVVLVEGRVKAEIVQNCVVSLVPVGQSIDEAISIRFARPGSSAAPEPGKPGAEVMIDPAGSDPPDLLTGPSVDLGAVVVEHFVLAIDPYPRAPGAELAGEAADPSDGKVGDSAFAALARLTDRRAKNG
jgi:uncharacterized metal-binding protein YceD (DUF177 family)